MHPLHRLLIAPAEIERVNQEVHVVAVMPVRVQRIGVQPGELVFRGGRERGDRFRNLVALRVDVSGHVQRVRDVGDERGVAFARVPRAFRCLAAFPGVNQVVMCAEMPIVSCDDLFEQPDRFHRVRARLFRHRIEAVVEREAEHRFGVEVVRIRGDERAERGDVRGVGGVLVRRAAPRRL